MKREVADWEDKTNTIKEEMEKLNAKLKEIGRDQQDAAEDDDVASSIGTSSFPSSLLPLLPPSLRLHLLALTVLVCSVLVEQ